jgi:hypothetical protein
MRTGQRPDAGGPCQLLGKLCSLGNDVSRSGAWSGVVALPALRLGWVGRTDAGEPMRRRVTDLIAAHLAQIEARMVELRSTQARPATLRTRWSPSPARGRGATRRGRLRDELGASTTADPDRRDGVPAMAFGASPSLGQVPQHDFALGGVVVARQVEAFKARTDAGRAEHSRRPGRRVAARGDGAAPPAARGDHPSAACRVPHPWASDVTAWDGQVTRAGQYGRRSAWSPSWVAAGR